MKKIINYCRENREFVTANTAFLLLIVSAPSAFQHFSPITLPYLVYFFFTWLPLLWVCNHFIISGMLRDYTRRKVREEIEKDVEAWKKYSAEVNELVKPGSKS